LNTLEFTYLITNPDTLTDLQTKSLENVLEKYPYLQSARALYLKGLYNQDSYKYNFALKTTAAYTTDRSVLFDFITSNNFINLKESENYFINNEIIPEFVKLEEVVETESLVSEEVEKEIISLTEEALFEIETIATTIKEVDDTQTLTEIEETLEIGKPIAFSTNEKHSFNEWLKLSNFKPIVREENTAEEEEKTLQSNNKSVNFDEIIDSKSKNIELIDKFIESKAKITRSNLHAETTPIVVEVQYTSHLMTETLAKVYLEQKKYDKAIKSYKILILKYPEKSIFFADRIKNIKDLQQNK